MTHPPSETVTHHLKTFTHICIKIMTHHFMKMTDPWRTSFCAHRNDGPIDEPCDALTVKWLTKTHIWVSVVTNLLLPWRYYASSIWQYMMHPWRTIPGGQEVRLTNDTCITISVEPEINRMKESIIHVYFIPQKIHNSNASLCVLTNICHENIYRDKHVMY